MLLFTLAAASLRCRCGAFFVTYTQNDSVADGRSFPSWNGTRALNNTMNNMLFIELLDQQTHRPSRVVPVTRELTASHIEGFAFVLRNSRIGSGVMGSEPFQMRCQKGQITSGVICWIGCQHYVQISQWTGLEASGAVSTVLSFWSSLAHDDWTADWADNERLKLSINRAILFKLQPSASLCHCHWPHLACWTSHRTQLKSNIHPAFSYILQGFS